MGCQYIDQADLEFVVLMSTLGSCWYYIGQCIRSYPGLYSEFQAKLCRETVSKRKRKIYQGLVLS